MFKYIYPIQRRGLTFHRKGSREDLEDMLNDPNYFQAVFHSLPQVKALLRTQMELGAANEELASTYDPRFAF